MKRNVIYLAFALISIFPFRVLGQSNGTTFEQAKSSKRANMNLIFVQTPGFITEGDDGEYEGILVSMMNDFATFVNGKYGIQVSYNYQHVANDDFHGMLQQIKNSRGGSVALSNITITDQRKPEYDFSIPYMSNVPVLVSHPSVPDLESLEDIATQFAGKQVFVAQGTTHEKRLIAMLNENGANLKINHVTYEQVILEKLSSDPNAISSIDFIYYASALKNKIRIKRHAVGDGESESFGLTLSKGNDWTPIFNEFLSSGYLQNSSYRKLVSDYLGYHALSLLSTLTK